MSRVVLIVNTLLLGIILLTPLDSDFERLGNGTHAPYLLVRPGAHSHSSTPSRSQPDHPLG